MFFGAGANGMFGGIVTQEAPMDTAGQISETAAESPQMGLALKLIF
jgi:hypothetical protein